MKRPNEILFQWRLHPIKYRDVLDDTQVILVSIFQRVQVVKLKWDVYSKVQENKRRSRDVL